MAAAQVLGSERYCACGCGGSLEGRHTNAVYTLECQALMREERDRKRLEKRTGIRRAARQHTGRVCGCGCGVSIDGFNFKTQFTPACIKRRKRERWNKKYAKEQQKKKIERAVHKTPYPRAAAVWQHRSPTDAPYVPTMKCRVCMDMPWARRPDRMQEHRDGYTCSDQAVGVDIPGLRWICKGCGEPYAPEPKPEPASYLQSSAGTTVRAGQFFGHEPLTNGNGPRYAKLRAEREALKKGDIDGG